MIYGVRGVRELEFLIIVAIFAVGMILEEYGETIAIVLCLAVAVLVICKVSKAAAKKAADEEARKQREREAQRLAEEQRIAQINLDKEHIASSLKSIFSSPINLNTISEAEKLIKSRMGVNNSDVITVSSDDVKAEARNYADRISIEIEIALEHRDLLTTTSLIDFLIYIGSASPDQKRIKEKVEELEFLMESTFPALLVMGSSYGVPNRQYVDKIRNDKRFSDPNSLLGEKLTILDLLWGLSLHRPVDYYRQGVLLKELWSLKNNGRVCINVMSSALVFRGIFQRELIDVFIPTFHHDLMSLVQAIDSGTAINLASVAAIADNTEDELFILSGLKKRNELPESLFGRYQSCLKKSS